MSNNLVKQRSLAKEISLTGVGLHTGKNVTMTFKPAPENYGYAFVRTDLEGQPVIEAAANYVVNTQRGTNLEKNGIKIHTTEHVLAALVGMQIRSEERRVGKECKNRGWPVTEKNNTNRDS